MDLKKAEKALRKLAVREGVSVEYIREKIQEAIDAATADPDPRRKRFWAAVPRRGERLSPEDLIVFLRENAGKLL